MAIKTALCRGREAGARGGSHWVGPETCCNKIICCNKYLKIQLSETFSSRRGQQPTGHGIHQWILATTTATAGAATGAHGKEALCAAPEALCLALPRSGFTFFFIFCFSPFFVMAFSCSHGVLHAPRAYGCCCCCCYGCCFFSCCRVAFCWLWHLRWQRRVPALFVSLSQRFNIKSV